MSDDLDRAQRNYDAMLPEDDPVCEECESYARQIARMKPVYDAAMALREAQRGTCTQSEEHHLDDILRAECDKAREG